VKKKKTAQEGLKIKGMFRLHIEDDGQIVGDSGWHENRIVNLGFLNFVNLLGTGLTGSKINAVALGTGTLLATDATVLPGEVWATGAGSSSVIRPVVTAVAVGSTTLRNTATFASSSSFASSTFSISNIGLWNSTGPVSTSGTIYAGNTYASSSLATNQNVNVTYDIVFS